MNTYKKLVSITLVLCMVLGSIATAFARDSFFDFDEIQNEKLNYVAFGDSITRGYGATTDWNQIYTMDSQGNKNCRIVKGSYPYELALKLGLNPDNDITNANDQYWPIAQDAVTTSYLLDLFGVDDNYHDTEFLWAGKNGMESRYTALLNYFGDPDSFTIEGNKYGNTGSVNSIKTLIQQSALITIDIGMGDVFNRSRQLAQDVLEKNKSDIKVLIKAVTTLVSEMYKGYERWEKNFPMILDYFKKNAPKEAKVVIIGAINPIFNMPITNDILIPVGTALSVITDKMNRQYEKWAKKYGYLYVDVSNVETGETQEGELGELAVSNINKALGLVEFLGLTEARQQGVLTHPTKFGYEQMADAIIDALAAEEGFSFKTTIKVDIGRINKDDLTSVKVDGLERKFYYFEGERKLCIPCLTKLAHNLTITAKNDGKTQLTFYDLDYKDGYRAKRLYTTNDLKQVKDFYSIKNIVSGIKDAIFGKE